MKCKNCNEDILVKDCSETEGLVFFGTCNRCKIVNKFTIDLDKNEIVSSLCHDDEIHMAKRLFDMKKPKFTKNISPKTDVLFDFIMEDSKVIGIEPPLGVLCDEALQEFNCSKQIEESKPSNSQSLWASKSSQSVCDIMSYAGNDYFKVKK